MYTSLYMPPYHALGMYTPVYASLHTLGTPAAPPVYTAALVLHSTAAVRRGSALGSNPGLIRERGLFAQLGRLFLLGLLCTRACARACPRVRKNR